MREVWGPHPGLFYELFLVVLGHLMNVCVSFLFFFFFLTALGLSCSMQDL